MEPMEVLATPSSLQLVSAQFSALQQFVTNGELTTKLVESAIITLFLALLAPLIQMIRTQERKRELAHDIMLFLQLEKMARDDDSDLCRAAANFVKRNTHLEQIVDRIIAEVPSLDGAGTAAGYSGDLEAAIADLDAPAPYNMWDAFGSLILPALFWLFMLIGAFLPPREDPLVLFAVVIAAASSFWSSYFAGKKIAKSFRSELLQRLFQLIFSVFSIMIGLFVVGFSYGVVEGL